MSEGSKLEYEDFISALQSGKIKKIEFFVKGYGHYKSCSISCEPAITKTGKLITVSLAKDEFCEFYGDFNEEEKLFHIKGKGCFTLKQIWKDIEIKGISYV